MRLLADITLREFRHRHWTLNSEIIPMHFYSLYFMHGFCCQVTFSTMRTIYDRYVFNDKKVAFLSITLCDTMNANTFFATNIAY